MNAPAVFLGLQEALPPMRPVELYNLTEPIPGHPAGSTVTRGMLERAGFEIPPAEAAKAAAAWFNWDNSAPGDDHHFPVVGGAPGRSR